MTILATTKSQFPSITDTNDLLWNVKYEVDPFADNLRSTTPFFIATAHIGIRDLLTSQHNNNSHQNFEAFEEGGRPARVALADYVARVMTQAVQGSADKYSPILIEVVHNHHSRSYFAPDSFSSAKTRSTGWKAPTVLVPFILERTDVWCTSSNLLYVSFRVQHQYTNCSHDLTTADTSISNMEAYHSKDGNTVRNDMVRQFLNNLRHQVTASLDKLMEHVSCNVLQHKMRNLLQVTGAISFIANGSILPRKNGASQQPMASPPAIPFQAPSSMTNTEPMTQKSIRIPMGLLLFYLPTNSSVDLLKTPTDSTVTITGLLIPKGITLICGGGYHGKSTLLRTIAASVYNKIPGDGREYCVTCENALVIRAEDGRYVNNCNVSAFISNLPFTTFNNSSNNNHDKDDSNFYFSSSDASGSTSQAANVVEAIEMGASALLVDEDVSAANFMARDGRMRALIQDESITPLLYRVNGLYDSLGISSIVVVGGVGDWLDVPHNVLLLNKYICSDATKKARSISEQFSYGHVQYAGRGVVHRLLWPASKTPRPRRPKQTEDNREIEVVTVPGNDSRLFLIPRADITNSTPIIDKKQLSALEDDGLDEHSGEIDMVRCEQLLGRLQQLYGCGLCVKWVLQASKSHTNASIKILLDIMEKTMDENGGIRAMLFEFSSTGVLDEENASAACHVLSTAGFSYRPRRFEVAMALTRMRGLILEDVPASTDEKNAEEERVAEEERKKKELLDLWQSRRNVHSE